MLHITSMKCNMITHIKLQDFPQTALFNQSYKYAALIRLSKNVKPFYWLSHEVVLTNIIFFSESLL